MKTKAGRYSVSTKKKKISYAHQLQQDLSPKSARLGNLQAVWVNSQGSECKQIIGPNRCFCTHSFECHQPPKTVGTAFCLVPGCKCKCYQYVPYYDIKCMCRHSYKEHDRNTKMCRMCEKCLGFVTNWCCKCGIKYEMHSTVFREKKQKKYIPPMSDRDQLNQISKTIDMYPTTFLPELYPYHTEPNNISTLTLTNSRTQINRPTDARTYQLQKHRLFGLKQQDINEQRIQESKRKQLNRINEKYSNNNFQKSIDNYDENYELGLSGVHRLELGRKVTAFQLLIRPHHYNMIKLQEFLEKEYRKKKEDGG